MQPVKPLLTFAFLVFAASPALAQGEITFSNGALGVNAPISAASGNRIIGPSSYVADLFWSSDTNAPMDSLVAAGSETGFSSTTMNGGGYFYGFVTLSVGEIPVLVQVRVWDASYGSTYYAARNSGGEFGFSNRFIITPSVPPGQPASLFGLQSFQLQRLPHVTTVLTTTNTIVFLWPAEQTAYSVQQNRDLSPTNWTTLSNAPVTIGQQQQVVVPVPATGRMFYRLVSQY